MNRRILEKSIRENGKCCCEKGNDKEIPKEVIGEQIDELEALHEKRKRARNGWYDDDWFIPNNIKRTYERMNKRMEKVEKDLDEAEKEFYEVDCRKNKCSENKLRELNKQLIEQASRYHFLYRKERDARTKEENKSLELETKLSEAKDSSKTVTICLVTSLSLCAILLTEALFKTFN